MGSARSHCLGHATHERTPLRLSIQVYGRNRSGAHLHSRSTTTPSDRIDDDDDDNDNGDDNHCQLTNLAFKNIIENNVAFEVINEQKNAHNKYQCKHRHVVIKHFIYTQVIKKKASKSNIKAASKGDGRLKYYL